MSKNVYVSIIGIDFEPPLRRSEPAVDQGAHLEPSFTAPERQRLLFAAIACVTLDTDRHRVMVLPWRMAVAPGELIRRRVDGELARAPT